jgi:hypothetical protein
MRSRKVLGVLAVLGTAAALAFLAWLPFDPFEEAAGPVEGFVPATVDSAWRFDGPSVLRSPFARGTWNREGVVDLRAGLDVDGRVLQPLRRVEQAFVAASLGLADPPGLERDLMPSDVIVATRGDDVLVATRISPRARALELVRALSEAQLGQLGLSVEGSRLVLRREGAPAIHLVRRSDVLLASTSPALLAQAADTGARGAGGIAGAPGAADALDLGRSPGRRILGWALPRALALRLAPDEAGQPVWAEILRSPGAEPVAVELDLAEADVLGVRVRLSWERDVPAGLAPFADVSPRAPASALAVLGGRRAVEGEAFVQGGLAASAGQVVRALLASQPPERQEAFEQALAAAGESVDSVAAALARHFDDGVGFVVARLREADTVIGADDAGATHAIPATVVVFRLRGPESGPALVEDVRRRAETLFGAPLGDQVEVMPDGTRFHTLERQGLAGQWELLRPAFAFAGDEFVFSTHDGYLRRALASRARTVAAAEGPERALHLHVSPATLRRWLDDQAWEHADRITWRDWAGERARIEASIPGDSPLTATDRTTYLDARIREMRRIRRVREIPQAAAAWRDRWGWLGHLGDADFAADVDGRGVTLRARLRPAE